MVVSFCEPPRKLLDYRIWTLRRDDQSRDVSLLRGQDSTKGLIVEIDGVNEETARAALALGAAKLSVKTRFIQRIAE